MYICAIAGGKRFHKAASEANYNNIIGKAGNNIPDNGQDRGTQPNEWPVGSRLSDHIPDFISLIVHVNHSSNGRKRIIHSLPDALSNANSYEDLGETFRRFYASLKEHDIADSSDLVSYLKLKFC